MNFGVKSEPNFDECSFLYSGNHRLDSGLLDNALKTRPQLLEFILDILSNPHFSLIMSWEGRNGQFAIRHPDLIARLWGDRNGRRNMTYKKFSRALRYYYRKNVLTKIRGRKYTYKFNLLELERQYKGITFPATNESPYIADNEIPSTGAWDSAVFPPSPSMLMPMPYEGCPFGVFSRPHFFPMFMEF